MFPPTFKTKLAEYMQTWVEPSNMQIYPRTAKQQKYLFCNRSGEKIKSFRKTFNSMVDKLGIENVTIHTMRHTYASHMVMKNVNMKVVQEFLGHHSVKVTERYAHLSNAYKQQAVANFAY